MENLHILSDEQLIKMAQEGSSTAMELLIEKYKGFVKLKAKPYFIAGQDTDDVVQEGMIGLFKAVRTYNEAKEASFKTFAGTCIDNQILNAIKKANRDKNKALNESISIYSKDDENEEVDLTELLFASSSDEPENVFLKKEVYLRLEKGIDEKLSDLEKKVIELKLTGVEYKEIASILNTTPKTIDNALQRAKKKLSDII